jgi:hypothetical protein
MEKSIKYLLTYIGFILCLFTGWYVGTLLNTKGFLPLLITSFCGLIIVLILILVKEPILMKQKQRNIYKYNKFLEKIVKEFVKENNLSLSEEPERYIIIDPSRNWTITSFEKFSLTDINDFDGFKNQSYEEFKYNIRDNLERNYEAYKQLDFSKVEEKSN